MNERYHKPDLDQCHATFTVTTIANGYLVESREGDDPLARRGYATIFCASLGEVSHAIAFVIEQRFTTVDA